MSSCADIGGLYGLVSKFAKGWLPIPVVKRDWSVQCRMIREKLGQPLLCEPSLALIKLLDRRLMLVTPPPVQKIIAPLVRIAVLEDLCTCAKRHACGVAPGF